MKAEIANVQKHEKYQKLKVFKCPYNPALQTQASPGSPVKSSAPG